MKRNVVWLLVSCLTVLLLFATSCTPVSTEEELVRKGEEVPSEVEGEVITENDKGVRIVSKMILNMTDNCHINYCSIKSNIIRRD